MRHQRKRHRIGRGASHRKATLAALSNALLEHKRITTTLAKAKALRVFVEPLISRGKEDTTHNRRMVFRKLHNKYTVTELFTDIAEKVGDRPGGYTRVIKLGTRAGDGAQLAMIELVDYNDVRPEGAAGSKSKRTRRSRRSKSSTTSKAKTQAPETPAAEPAADAGEEKQEG